MAFALLYVFGFGFNLSLSYMVPVHHGWLWWPERPGLVSGLIICGFGFGALTFNTVSLMMVNPDNLSADDEGKFPDDVNSNLPKMLTTVIYIFMAITFVAILMISPGPVASCRESTVQRELDETLVNEVIGQGLDGLGIEELAISEQGSASDSQGGDCTTEIQKQARKERRKRRAIKKKVQKAKLCMALKSGQFWMIYAMSCLSISKLFFCLFVS